MQDYYLRQNLRFSKVAGCGKLNTFISVRFSKKGPCIYLSNCFFHSQLFQKYLSYEASFWKTSFFLQWWQDFNVDSKNAVQK